jgi:hypothetical protein
MGIDFFRDGEEIRKRKKVRFGGGGGVVIKVQSNPLWNVL